MGERSSSANGAVKICVRNSASFARRSSLSNLRSLTTYSHQSQHLDIVSDTASGVSEPDVRVFRHVASIDGNVEPKASTNNRLTSAAKQFVASDRTDKENFKVASDLKVLTRRYAANGGNGFQRSHSEKNLQGRTVSAPTPFTILKRPQSHEAAVENLARLFGVSAAEKPEVKDADNSSASVVEDVDVEESSIFRDLDRNFNSQSQSQLMKSYVLDIKLTDEVSGEVGLCHGSSRQQGFAYHVESEKFQRTGSGLLISPFFQTNSVNGGSPAGTSSCVTPGAVCGLNSFMPRSYSKSQSVKRKQIKSKYQMHEKWAGPGYSNSPSPSSLPLPSFPVQSLRTEATPATPTRLQSAPASVASPMSPFSGFSYSSAGLEIQQRRRDVHMATNALRRILNLDVL